MDFEPIHSCRGRRRGAAERARSLRWRLRGRAAATPSTQHKFRTPRNALGPSAPSPDECCATCCSSKLIPVACSSAQRPPQHETTKNHHHCSAARSDSNGEQRVGRVGPAAAAAAASAASAAAAASAMPSPPGERPRGRRPRRRRSPPAASTAPSRSPASWGTWRAPPQAPPPRPGFLQRELPQPLPAWFPPPRAGLPQVVALGFLRPP